MLKEHFASDKKETRSLFTKLEGRLIKILLPRIPLWLKTQYLTLLTILWSGLVILFSYWAQFSIYWLWLVSLIIFFQYISDLLNGKVGKVRRTGLIRWGYYMDHFLDYIFLCSILIGYSFFIADDLQYLLFFILAIAGAFMVNSFLAFPATNVFKISHFRIGPTEIRLLFVLTNIYLIFSGKFFTGIFLAYVLGFSFVVLSIVVYSTQRKIWKIDMKNK